MSKIINISKLELIRFPWSRFVVGKTVFVFMHYNNGHWQERVFDKCKIIKCEKGYIRVEILSGNYKGLYKTTQDLNNYNILFEDEDVKCRRKTVN